MQRRVVSIEVPRYFMCYITSISIKEGVTRSDAIRSIFGLPRLGNGPVQDQGDRRGVQSVDGYRSQGSM